MGALEGQHVVVAGGTGAVGEGIVRVLLDEGATVLVPSRSKERIEALRAYVGQKGSKRLRTWVGHIGTPEGAEAFKTWVLTQTSKIDGVVASVGSWWQGPPLYEVPYETYQEVLHQRLTSHFLLIRAFVPVLLAQGHGLYVTLGGSHAENPFPKSSLVSIAGAAQLMMTRIMMEELQTTAVRWVHLLLGPVNTRKVRDQAKPDWITAEEVGEFIAFLLSPQGRMVGRTVIRLYSRPPQT